MYQVSLSTLLTPPSAPGAGMPAALSGAFSAALAGLATPPGGADVGKSAAGARQPSAEAGKSLPTEAGESLTLPAPADDWLDQVALLAASPSPQSTAPAGDSPGSSATSKADQTPKRGKIASLPVDGSPQLAADSIVTGTAVASLQSDGDKPAAHPASPARARKKTDDAAATGSPTAVVVALPPVAAPALPVDNDAAGAIPGDGPANPATPSATPASVTVQSGVDARASAAVAAPTMPRADAGDNAAAATAMLSSGSSRADPVAPVPGSSVAPGTTGEAATGGAPLQPAARQASADIGKPTGIAASDPNAVAGDKTTRATTTEAASQTPSRAAAADATPASNAVAAPPRVAAAPLPAGMLFGIALDQRATADRSSPRDEALQALTALAAAGSAAPVVAAAGGEQHGTLDMRRDDWPQAMIDRIDALRDAADATSTRITLMPDALGKVDVSLRHDGDTVHVHFAADTAQTRTMLADAQPRLAEAAQARGIRLGQTSVGTGGGEAGRQTPRQPAAPVPVRPVSAAPAQADIASDSSRLA